MKNLPSTPNYPIDGVWEGEGENKNTKRKRATDKVPQWELSNEHCRIKLEFGVLF